MFAPQTCPLLELFGIAQKFATTSAAELAAAVSKLTGHAFSPPKPTKSPGPIVTEPASPPASAPAPTPSPTFPSTPKSIRRTGTTAPSSPDSSIPTGLSRASSQASLALTDFEQTIQPDLGKAHESTSAALAELRLATMQLIGAFELETPIPSGGPALAAQTAEETSTATAASITPPPAALAHVSPSELNDEADEKALSQCIDTTSIGFAALTAKWKTHESAKDSPLLRIAPSAKKIIVAKRELNSTGAKHAAGGPNAPYSAEKTRVMDELSAALSAMGEAGDECRTLSAIAAAHGAAREDVGPLSSAERTFPAMMGPSCDLSAPCSAGAALDSIDEPTAAPRDDDVPAASLLDDSSLMGERALDSAAFEALGLADAIDVLLLDPIGAPRMSCEGSMASRCARQIARGIARRFAGRRAAAGLTAAMLVAAAAVILASWLC